MNPYLLAAIITAVSVRLLAGPRLRQLSPLHILLVLALSGATGAFLYHPGNWGLISLLAIVSVVAFLFRRIFWFARTNPEALTRPSVPAAMLGIGVLLAFNWDAYPVEGTLAGAIPLVLILASGLWLLLNPVIDTFKQPQPLRHMLENIQGVACYLMSVTTIVMCWRALAHPTSDNFGWFLLAFVVTLFMNGARLAAIGNRRRQEERETRDAASASA